MPKQFNFQRDDINRNTRIYNPYNIKSQQQPPPHHQQPQQHSNFGRDRPRHADHRKGNQYNRSYYKSSSHERHQQLPPDFTKHHHHHQHQQYYHHPEQQQQQHYQQRPQPYSSSYKRTDYNDDYLARNRNRESPVREKRSRSPHKTNEGDTELVSKYMFSGPTKHLRLCLDPNFEKRSSYHKSPVFIPEISRKRGLAISHSQILPGLDSCTSDDRLDTAGKKPKKLEQAEVAAAANSSDPSSSDETSSGSKITKFEKVFNSLKGKIPETLLSYCKDVDYDPATEYDNLFNLCSKLEAHKRREFVSLHSCFKAMSYEEKERLYKTADKRLSLVVTPYYVNNEISKEGYKTVMRKLVKEIAIKIDELTNQDLVDLVYINLIAMSRPRKGAKEKEEEAFDK